MQTSEASQFSTEIPAQLRVSYTAQPESRKSGVSSAIGPLLEICLAQANAQGAYVYQLDPAQLLLDLAAWRGLRPTEIMSYQVQFDTRSAAWRHEANTVLASLAWRDWRFQNFPEFLHNRFESVLSIPIRDGGQITGFANFCRKQASNFQNNEIAFLSGLSLPLGGLLRGAEFSEEKSRLATELEKANQKLADRKLLERAKGLLQSRFALTEEEAYFRLRRTSRQTRTKMRAIAQHVIDHVALPETFAGAKREAAAND